jgi:hypothetical protein
VLVVLASSRDSVAARLVERWASHGAGILTSRDLSRDGWRYTPGRVARSVAVVGGERVRASDIEGVLVRLPYVPVDELGHIVPDDRTYVAQEMTALLTAWLSELRCRVVNQPSARCLAGPGWGAAQWRHSAASLGLRMGRRADSARATLVGGRVFGPADRWAAVRQLAEAAGVDLLELRFDDAQRVVGIDPWPDVAHAELADALLAWFRAA